MNQKKLVNIGVDNRGKKKFYLNYSQLIDKNSICVEIGVWRGYNAEEIITCNPKQLYLVDCWDDQTQYMIENKIIPHSHSASSIKEQNIWYNEVVEKFKPHKNVQIIKEYSNKAVTRFDDKYFDFIYIDGLHDYNSVLEDITLWSKKLKDTGIILCDDYAERSELQYGVIPAISQFLNQNKLYIGESVMTTGEGEPTRWFIIKKYN